MAKNDLYDVPHIGSLRDMLIKSAQKYPDKLALEDLNDTPIPSVTYSQLLKNVLKFGTALRNLGVKERAKVAIIGENRVQWGIAYLTCVCFNYVVVPIDRKLSESEIINIIHESDAEAIIYSSEFHPLFLEKSKIFRKMKFYICMDYIKVENNFYTMIDLLFSSKGCSLDNLPQINPEELAVILFTSGTLGKSKGVMLSQKNLTSNLMSMVSAFYIYPEDRFLSVLPIHHTYECTCGFLCPIYCGASVHYSRSLKTIVEDMQKVHPTILLGVPLLYDKMYRGIRKAIQEKKITSIIISPLITLTNILEGMGIDLKRRLFKEIHEKFGGSIRAFITGGAKQDPVIAKGLREFGFTFIQGYGLTETSPILTLNRLNNFRDDSAGLPLPRVEIKIANPDSEGNGEIWAKGPNIMLGYYKNEKVTKEVMENGWFKTGDIGHVDSDGFLYINGRKKNVIISKSGKNVYPEEIEDILNRSPFILESMVYAEQDSKHGEIIKAQIYVDAEAFIELSEKENIQINEQVIQEIIRKEIQNINKNLAPFKRIQDFIIRDKEFEKTTVQKIKRYANVPE